MKLTLAILASLVAASASATTISTSDNSGFYNIPLWMPKSSNQYQTPGSSSFFPHQYITVSDAAALYSVFNGYCERCYYLNRGPKNRWSTQQYGPTIPAWFLCPADYALPNRGDRSVEPTRALIALDRMRAIGSKLRFDDMYCYRPGWYYSNDSRLFAVSSSKLMYEQNEGAGDWTLLCDLEEEMPEFDWMNIPEYNGKKPCDMFLGMNNFFPDEIFNTDYGEERGWGYGPTRSIGFWALEPITYGCTTNYWCGDRDGLTYMTTKFADSMKHQFGTNCNVYAALHPTNILESVQPWMSETGRILAMEDVAYTAYRVGFQTNSVKTEHTVSRIGSYERGELTWNVTHVGGGESGSDPGAELGSTINVSPGDWTVSDMIPTTNVVRMGGLSNSHELMTGKVEFMASHGELAPIAYGLNSPSMVLAGDIASHFQNATNELFRIEYNDDPLSLYGAGWRVIFRDGASAATIEEGPYRGSYTTDGQLLASRAARDYWWRKTEGDVDSFDSFVKIGSDWSIIGNVLVSDRNSLRCGDMPDPEIVFKWKAIRGWNASASMTNDLNGFVGSCADKVMSISTSRWGNYYRPTQYAYVDPSEARWKGTIRYGTAAASHEHTQAPYQGAGQEGYHADFTDGHLYNLRDAKGVMLIEGLVPDETVLFTIALLIQPDFVEEEYQRPYTNQQKYAHRACANAVLFQRLHLEDPASLKAKDGPGPSPEVIVFGQIIGPFYGSNE